MKKISKILKLVSIVNIETDNRKIFIRFPTILIGFKIKLSGRSLLERSKPRITKIEFIKGTFNTNRFKIVIDKGSTQKTNDLGSISVSVTLISVKI